MHKALVTGSLGLVGGAVVEKLVECGWHVTGVDNDMRSEFFPGVEKVRLGEMPTDAYKHLSVDVRQFNASQVPEDLGLIVHAAAQPSHDWAKGNVLTDFEINAVATVRLLEIYRHMCPEAVFIFVSTNKVYGDSPNKWPQKPFDETLPMDRSNHSFFGCSKAAADLYAQEYGRNFGLKVGIFRPGCITGAGHRGTEQHGFLNYLVKCAKENKKYRVYGHNGKQVRDNVHAMDVADAFYEFWRRPRCGEVYNIGGGPNNATSVVQAIQECNLRTGRQMDVEYVDVPRFGDHYWYVTDNSKLWRDFGWSPRTTLKEIYDELFR